MGRQIHFTDPVTEKKYTLEYNRTAVKRLEAAGFYIDDESLKRKTYTTLTTLFHGAFFMHHRNVKLSEAEVMMERFENKEALIEELMKMYMEPTRAISSEEETDGEEVDRKNLITWSSAG